MDKLDTITAGIHNNADLSLFSVQIRARSLPFYPVESLLLVLLAHEEAAPPGGVYVEPDPVLLADI